MALSSTITVQNASAANVTFDENGIIPGGKSRINTASTLTEPQLFVIKHSTSGKGANTVDRHLIQVSVTKLDANGVPYVAVMNFTMAIPRSTLFTRATEDNMISYITSFLGVTANKDAILIGGS